jgi:hypothetical protein
MSLTKSNGEHHWYKGRHLFHIGRPDGPHPYLDFAQYLVLPGTELLDGRSYRWANDLDFAQAPEWFYEVGAKKVRTSAGWTPKGERVPLSRLQAPSYGWDHPGSITRARDFLRIDAPDSVEGESGEHTLLMIGASLKDFGIHYETACELVDSIYNNEAHCDPPWSLDELRSKLRNAYEYLAENEPGCDAPAEVDFGADPLDPADYVSAISQETDATCQGSIARPGQRSPARRLRQDGSIQNARRSPHPCCQKGQVTCPDQ